VIPQFIVFHALIFMFYYFDLYHSLTKIVLLCKDNNLLPMYHNIFILFFYTYEQKCYYAPSVFVIVELHQYLLMCSYFLNIITNLCLV
jgi:hypothetical protein